jgi:membrane-bound lytic murein transglycosylase A
MQKLVFAQDTGGAIRGAVRADHFWGFGPEAARQANNTKHRGEMWLMMPTAEFRELKGKRVVTRGAAAGPTDLERDCLVPDEQFCAE